MAQYYQCRDKYQQNKQIIDKFIIQSIFFEFSNQNQKYTSFLNHIINNINNPYQLNLDDQDKYLFNLLKQQYQDIKQCKEMFFQYIDTFYDIDNPIATKQLDEIKLYYFKASYFSSLESQKKKLSGYYSLSSVNNENFIQNIITIIEELRENHKNKQILKEQINQKTYDNILHQQKFYKSLQNNQIKHFESYSIYQKQNILWHINSHFSIEEQFFKDFFSCIEIIGENFKIKKQKLDKENLYLYTEYSLLRNEFFVNLVEKYEINQFQFYDKQKILNLFADPTYIENKLSQDETVLYFYMVSVLNLIKFRYLASNVQQNLYLLIKKINTFDELKQNSGIKFTMKIIKDLKEKDCLDESLYKLFNDWNTQPDYKVSDNWINKEQIQLHIDAFQSMIKLLVIPELARFFFQNKQPIPFQISNYEFALIQSIIIGKQFFLNHPDRITDQLNFQKELCNQIHQFASRAENTLPFQICQINIKMCQILEEKIDQNKDLQLLQLYQNINSFIQMIDCSLYFNIYRKKQLFYTLQSLFIKDEIIIPIIIQQLKFLNIFSSSNTGFPFISLKQNFDELQYFQFNQSKNKFEKITSDKDFDMLFKRIYQITQLQKNCQTNKQTILNQFKNIIYQFRFLDKFEVFKFNIEIYIKQIELEIGMDPNTKYRNIQNIRPLQQCQFKIDYVKLNEQYVVKKYRNTNSNNNIKIQKEQLINECSILLLLQKYKKTHNNIIKYIDHRIENGEIELFLEYCEKGSLFSFLRQILNKEQKIQICIDILKGVEFLHQNNILHGDLKLGNIVVDKNNVIKIIDFGSGVHLIKQCTFQTEGYKSEDSKQSLFYDYNSIGLILFSVLLNDNQFPRNYTLFKGQKVQNKILTKEYFKIQQNQKEIIEKEYSSTLFKELLSLFNDQPYLRPKLSELIKLLEDHKINESVKNTVKQTKYSIKEEARKLQQKYENSKLVKQIDKNFFNKYELQEEKKEDKQDYKENNVLNQQLHLQNQNTYNNEQYEITTNKNQKKQCVFINKQFDQYINQQRYQNSPVNELQEEIKQIKQDQSNKSIQNKENNILNEQEYLQNQNTYNNQQDDITIKRNSRQQCVLKDQQFQKRNLNSPKQELKEEIKQIKQDQSNKSIQNKENNILNEQVCLQNQNTNNNQEDDITINRNLSKQHVLKDQQFQQKNQNSPKQELQEEQEVKQEQLNQSTEDKENMLYQLIQLYFQNTNSIQQDEITTNRNQKKQCLIVNQQYDQNVKQQMDQNSVVSEQNIRIQQIEDNQEKSDDSFESLIDYFVGKIDTKKMYSIGLFKYIKNPQFNLRKFEIDLNGFLTQSNNDKFDYGVKNILIPLLQQDGIIILQLYGLQALSIFTQSNDYNNSQSYLDQLRQLLLTIE